jgi:hypothetical protein
MPLGAPMVSSEGTCAAFYAAGRGIGIGAAFSGATPLVPVAADGGPR